MLDKAWKRLLENDVGIMGMYGMGGVGKTTLLTQLNNKFSKERCGFDYVLWVVVSKELNLERIRDDIAQKLCLNGKTKEVIYSFLRKKRFVLFLDDLWEKVDLAEIGIPFPTVDNKCKVTFTTRLQDVCAKMRVEESMEVECMEDDVAFDLFQKKVGQRTLESDPEILELAKTVARKCRGLPLALNVIGETMSCKKTIQEWHHAVDVLNRYASEFSGMEDKILPLLKYSYDNFKEEEVKLCLLYCALFPEDHNILKERLINYLICEEIIDGSEGIERAENKGYEIIGSLVRASLLMEGVDAAKRDYVYLHDVVREMALWIASGLGKQKETFIVRAGVGLSKMPKIKNHNNVRRMSFMENDIHHLDGSPKCPELTTLLLQKTKLEKITDGFFNFMPKLAVLDLSENERLYELPDGVSELVSLQYLNLSHTRIRRLPMSGKGLKKLIHLNLRETYVLPSLEGISNLHNLKVLELYGSFFSWDLKTVEELETLEHLEVITLRIKRRPLCLVRYLNSHKLVSCTRELRIHDIDLGSSEGISLPVTMKNLREFSILACSIPEIKMVQNPRNTCLFSLCKVEIMHCKILKELTFLMFAPNLKHLDVKDASQLEDIINKEKACESGKSETIPFKKLIFLRLTSLRVLKSIYWRPLPFPCLKEFNVIVCPNLKKLPLDSQSGTHGEKKLIIKYRGREWIEGVEWEDEATKTRFVSSCVKMEYADSPG